MRLAYFIPLPPSKSGIADYNSELLPYMAKGSEISVFVAEGDGLRENRGRALPLVQSLHGGRRA